MALVCGSADERSWFFDGICRKLFANLQPIVLSRFFRELSIFKGRHFDQSVILLCVRWYLAYNLSLRDLEEMMAEQGSVPPWPELRFAKEPLDSGRIVGVTRMAAVSGFKTSAGPIDGPEPDVSLVRLVASCVPAAEICAAAA